MLESKLNLPNIIKQQAYQIYKEAVEKGLCIGRNNLQILLAAVYAACTINNIPKTADEISEYTEISQKHLLRAYKLLKRELKLNINNYAPEDLIPRFSSNLGLNHLCQVQAIQILQQIKGSRTYSGKNPKSIIAGAIYIAAKQNQAQITQRQIANQVGVMETTIRKMYKEIEREIGKKADSLS